MKNLLIILLTILVSFACTNQKEKTEISTPLVFRDGLLYPDSTSNIPFTGRNKSRMMDQIIEYDVVNGVKEGDFIIYYPNNKIQMIGKTSNNLNVGEWKYYYIDGALESIGNYVEDKPSDLWKWYYPNGKIAEEGNFIEGKRDGEWKSYDTTGTLKFVRMYKLDSLVDSVFVK